MKQQWILTELELINIALITTIAIIPLGTTIYDKQPIEEFALGANLITGCSRHLCVGPYEAVNTVFGFLRYFLSEKGEKTIFDVNENTPGKNLGLQDELTPKDFRK